MNRFIDGLEVTKDYIDDIDRIDDLWNKIIILRSIGEAERALNLLSSCASKDILFKALYGETLLFKDYQEGVSILSSIGDLTSLPLTLKISVLLSLLNKIKGVQDEGSLKDLKRRFLEEEGIRLNIVFYALHSNLTGGARIFFEYANRLSRLGHNVCIASKVSPPDWYRVEVPWINFEGISPNFKIIQPDVIFSMFWTLVPNTLQTEIPVKILLEQGDPTLYDQEKFSKELIDSMNRCYTSPIRIFTVSKNLKRLLRDRYNRDAFYIPNGIDTNLFKPISRKDNPEPIIMLVGADDIYFKGIKDVLEALKILKDRGYRFEVRQVTPTGRVLYNFEREIIVRPSQETLSYLYATSDIFVSGSYFETFHLPPLEAMASGTPVVTTDNGGIEYCKNEVNSLIVPPKDPMAMADAIERLLLDKELRDRLAEEGLKTAKEYNWDGIIRKIEDRLYDEVVSPVIRTNLASKYFHSIIELKDRNYLFVNLNNRILREIIDRYTKLHSKDDSSLLIIANSPQITERTLLDIIESLGLNAEDIPDIVLLEEHITELDIWAISQYLDGL